MYTQLSQGEHGDEGSDGDGDDDNNYGDDVHWDGEELGVRMMMMSNAGLHRVHASKPPGDLLQSSLITDSVTTDLDKDARKLNHKHFLRTNETNRPYFGRAKNMETGSVQLLHSFFKCPPEFPFLIQNQTCSHFPSKNILMMKFSLFSQQ